MASSTRWNKIYKKYYNKYGSLLILMVVLIIAVPIIYFFLSLPKLSFDGSANNNFSGCMEGEKKECTAEDNCKGTITCHANEWGVCIVPKICNPGYKKSCWEGCNEGYIECNECGTEYSECILNFNQP